MSGPIRLCSRPGCAGRRRQPHLPLRPLAGLARRPRPERDPHAYDLCERHAARLSVPLGWRCRRPRQRPGRQRLHRTQRLTPIAWNPCGWICRERRLRQGRDARSTSPARRRHVVRRLSLVGQVVSALICSRRPAPSGCRRRDDPDPARRRHRDLGGLPRRRCGRHRGGPAATTWSRTTRSVSAPST